MQPKICKSTVNIHGIEHMATYTPPKVWVWDRENGGRFSKINRPTAGAQFQQKLPIGNNPLQLYSLGTPNGVKVTMLLEELLERGHQDAEYDAWLIRIGKGDQFGSDFVDINPNSKIPALLDRSSMPSTRVFESGAILIYLAEKYDELLPNEPAARAECFSWLFWQMGSSPYLGGGFGHFFAYAPEKFEYPINRYAMEVKRQLDVLNKRLAENKYICGNEFTIADIAIWPWYGQLVLNRLYNGAVFLETDSYTHVKRWTIEIGARKATQRGRMVNKMTGKPEEQLRERHHADDFENKTQDKLENG